MIAFFGSDIALHNVVNTAPKKLGESRSVEFEINGLVESFCKVTEWINGEGLDIMSIDKYLDNKLCVSTDVETTDKYWDCECEHNYIHPKSRKHWREEFNETQDLLKTDQGKLELLEKTGSVGNLEMGEIKTSLRVIESLLSRDTRDRR